MFRYLTVSSNLETIIKFQVNVFGDMTPCSDVIG